MFSLLAFSFVFPLLDEIPEYSSPFVSFIWAFYGSHPPLSPLEFLIQGQLVPPLLLNDHRHGAPRQSANAFPFNPCSAGSSGSSTHSYVFYTKFNISTIKLQYLAYSFSTFCAASTGSGEFLFHREGYFLVEGVGKGLKSLFLPQKTPEMRPLLQERRCPQAQQPLQVVQSL